MSEELPSRPVKVGRSRSVRLERAAGGEPRAVKRFAAPGRLAALRDGARARREHALLELLSARGLPVPRPVELRRVADGWEVVAQWIDGAATLDDLLDGRAAIGETVGATVGATLGVDSTGPAGLARLARPLGVLLARLHAAGIDHPDLHPGNVLAGRGGELHLIDFHAARVRPSVTAALCARDLESVAASVRERASRTFRARFLLAWLAELPPELRARLPARAELALAVEEHARIARREVVRGRARRFLREGGAVRALARGPLEGFERRDADEWVLAELARAVERSCWSAREDRREIELRNGVRALAIAGRPVRHLRSAWSAAARLDEHRIACARPLAFASAPRPFAAFELPEGARPLSSAGAKDRAHVARALGFLLGSLADRGLWIPDLALRDVHQDGAGRAFLCGVATLEEHRPRRGSIAALPLHAELGALPDEPFAAGWRAAARGGDRARTERELALG